MTVKELIDKNLFQLMNRGNNIQRKIRGVYCCDLLSHAMGRIPRGSAWITVVANMNTLAVAKLRGVNCIILAEGVCFSDSCLNKAREKGITVLYTDLPVFEAALHVNKYLDKN